MKNTVIPWAKPDYWGNETKFVTDAVQSSWISGGPYVDKFEFEISKFCEIQQAVAVCNGTAAIHLAYLAIGIGADDEVVVPGFSFLAAANIALLCGAKPVFAEVDPKTWCVTAEAIEKCLSPRTKAIVPVHTYGNVCEMDEILALAKRENLFVIEDAAESFGSQYKGRVSGTLGDLGTFSFHATKTITTGEGGMVVTNNRMFAEKMALYRSHGMQRKQFYLHDLPGHNFRLTNLQAALGCAQFERLNAIVDERNRVYRHYVQELDKIEGLSAQTFSKNVTPVLWAIAVELDPSAFPQGRDEVMNQMKADGVETRPGFVAPSLMDFYHCHELPTCEKLSRQVISLPTYPSLTNEMITDICSKLKKLKK